MTPPDGVTQASYPPASLQNGIWDVGGVRLWLVSPLQWDGPLDLCGGSDPPWSGLPLPQPGLVPGTDSVMGALDVRVWEGVRPLCGQVLRAMLIWQNPDGGHAGWSVSPRPA